MIRTCDVRRPAPGASGARPAWWTDARAAREAALGAARPCVLILNADSGAL